jgi:4a-hydroxytetrahydrobiopterin dehydratase
MALLSDREIADRLQRSSWSRSREAIVREWKLADFAERADHHPDILVHGWNRVRLELATHSEGGLTAADFALAEQIDALTQA